MTGHDRLAAQMIAGLKDHLRTGKRPRIPEAGVLAWRWFTDLHARRTGTDPIAFAEIEGYGRLHRWPLESRHVTLITAMDQAFIAHINAKQPGQSPAASQSSPLSPALFDAVWN